MCVEDWSKLEPKQPHNVHRRVWLLLLVQEPRVPFLPEVSTTCPLLGAATAPACAPLASTRHCHRRSSKELLLQLDDPPHHLCSAPG